MINIVYSRHSRRRMKLYGITELDVQDVCSNGSRKVLADGRIEILWKSGEKFQYPLKIVGIETADEGFLVITAYPLKGTKISGEI
jgi:hypothetical protein